jgi:glycosyltransferase involved in cell wall biosynthesis
LVESGGRIIDLGTNANAEAFIRNVLDQIPDNVWNNPHFSVEILIIDDNSSDNTFNIVADYTRRFPAKKITLLYNPKNQGYGAIKNSVITMQSNIILI